MSTSYPSDLTDAEWEYLQRHLPLLSSRGRPPTHSLRTIFNAIFYVLRTGCPWRYLPANFPRFPNRVLPFSRLSPQRYLDTPASSLSLRRTRTARKRSPPERCHHGCGIRVNTVEESAGICGYDAHKHIKGRKRHLLVDNLGIPLSIYFTPLMCMIPEEYLTGCSKRPAKLPIRFHRRK
jgi:putative transposase